MNKNIDFDTRKYLILLTIVCVLFVIAIVKAFDYLPQKEETQIEQVVSKEINTSSQRNKVLKEEQNDNTDEDDEDNNEDNDENNSEDIETTNDDSVEFVEVDTPSGAGIKESAITNQNQTSKSELTSEEKALKALFAAYKAKKADDLKTAIEEFQKVETLTDDKELIASSYEGISQIYAANRRFGTALSFALKANNMSPNYSREILVAKIYYKTGDIEKATKIVTDLLKRDFTKNR